MPKRVDRAVSQRLASPDGKDMPELVNREMLPLLQELREAHNLSVGPMSPTITEDTIVDASYQFWPADATAGVVTLKLPPALGWSLPLYFKKLDASGNAVIVAGDGTDLIDGAATNSLGNQYNRRLFVSDGDSNWWRFG